MKKFLVTLAMVSFAGISLTACPGPGTSNPSASPSASASPGTGGTITTRAQTIAYLTCLKGKNPGTALALDTHINLLTQATDAQFALNGGAQAYLTLTQGYDKTGCL